MNKYKYIFLLFFTTNVLCLFSQTGPGGVGNTSTNLLWVRADRGLTNAGNTVTSWSDLGGNNNSPTGVSPSFNSSISAINNMPAVNFSSVGPYQNIFNIPSGNFTVISVFEGMNQALIPIWGTINTLGGYWPNYVNRTYVAPNCTWQSIATLHQNNQWEISTVRHLPNRTEVRTGGVLRYSRNQGYCPSWLNSFSFGGATPPYGGYPSGIAEMFYFNGQLNDAQMNIIENYLSSKYSLPIATDRYAYEGTGHYYDVCGIAQTNASSRHDDSQGNTRLRINTPSGLGNNEYLMWGHDNAPFCSSTNVPSSLKYRLQRTWRVNETGNVGTVSVSFDLTNIYNGNLSGLKLLLDNDGNFTNATIINAASVTGNTYTFNLVNFSDGQYFTVATNDVFYVGDGSTTTTWLGTNNTNWQASSNWTNGTPNLNTDVIISSGATNMPIINNTANCRNITIQSGATLTINGSNTFNVYGNWINQGAFVVNNSTVNFRSTCGKQRISCSTTQDFYHLQCTGIEGADLVNGLFNQRGVLTISNGTLQTNNLLTLVSDANRTASIAEMTTGNILGNVIVQRYIDAGATNWRFLTSPVSGATIANWQDNFITSGYPGSLWPLWPTPSNPWPSIYTYNEAVSGTWSNGYTAASSSAQPLNVGQGFWVWCGDTITGTQPFTIDVPGPINKFNISIPVNYTNSGSIADDGWNMIGNPYPSTIDWNDPAWTKVRLDNAIYIWDPDLQQYRSYVGGVGNNGGSNLIASSQGFWVKANAALPSLTIREGVKDNTDMSFVKMATTLPYRINLTNTLNNYTDQVTFSFNENATTNFEGNFDAHKVFGPNNIVPSISALSTDSNELSINAFNSKSPSSFPLILTLKQTGNYVFDFDNLPALNDIECVYLEDKQSNAFVDLKVAKSYSFSSGFGTINNRFYIHFSGISEVVVTNASCEYTNDGKAIVNAMGTGPWTYTWKDNNGKIIKTFISSNSSDSILNLQEGKYSVEITSSGWCKNSSKNFTIKAAYPTLAKFQYPAQVNLSENGKAEFINQSVNATTYNWDFGDGNSSTQQNPTNYYLLKGIYNVELTAANQYCQSNLKQTIEVVDDLTGIVTYATSEINFFPNPVKPGGTMNLSFTDFTSYANIEITDISGRLVFTSSLNVNGNSVSFLLPENITEGNYQLMVKADSESKNFRLLVK